MYKCRRVFGADDCRLDGYTRAAPFARFMANLVVNAVVQLPQHGEVPFAF